MARYIGKRLLQMVFLLLGITFIVFTSLYLAPGDPAELVAEYYSQNEQRVR